MSSKKLAIAIRGISKEYTIVHDAPRHSTVAETLLHRIRHPFNRPEQESFWALKDVSLDINRGEVVGVIGRNGAGKSTLLKILSRITEPTTGEIDLHGAVGSLLEVGTGFHAELTGRENIYLNGAILGMKRQDIRRQFDAIVDFAEVEQFIDTPVKRYSSGMYVRLAFAVAAHLSCDILVVDEVLAVGDSAFQKRCLGRMDDVAKSGKTVLFVSHNMPIVRSLCTKCCLLRSGRVAMIGDVAECVNEYSGDELRNAGRHTVMPERPSHASPWIRKASLLCGGQCSAEFNFGDSLSMAVEFASDVPTRHVRIGYVISTPQGEPILNANNRYQVSNHYADPVGEGLIRIDLGAVPLMPNRYTISLYLGDQVHDSHTAREALSFDVLEKDIWGSGQLPPPRVSHLWWPTRFTLGELEPQVPAFAEA